MARRIGPAPRQVKRSSGRRSGVAPRASRPLLPSADTRPVSAGTTHRGRPSVQACSAEWSAPLPKGHSTRIKARARATCSRLRWAKVPLLTAAPGGNSESKSPRWATVACRDAWWRGYTRSSGVPSTPTGAPASARQPSWAAPSIPAARPLTTGHPPRANAAPICRATCNPWREGRRVPTTATPRRSLREDHKLPRPAQWRTVGRGLAVRRAGGQWRSPGSTTPRPPCHR